MLKFLSCLLEQRDLSSHCGICLFACGQIDILCLKTLQEVLKDNSVLGCVHTALTNFVPDKLSDRIICRMWHTIQMQIILWLNTFFGLDVECDI